MTPERIAELRRITSITAWSHWGPLLIDDVVELLDAAEEVAALREALDRIASDKPFFVQCGGGIDMTASMGAVNRANYEQIVKLIAREALAATAPKEPAK